MFAKRLVVLLAVAASACTAAQSEEINWRTDYAAAREEAAAKKLPLVLEITADFCHWCRKLEATTLSDPAIVDTVNKHFIAVKVHHEQQTWLTKALGITGYPTMVLAGANGRIALYQEGYVDAATFQRQLDQLSASATAPAGDTEIRAVSTSAP